MSSINLLPKNIKTKQETSDTSGGLILFVSFLLIIASISLPVGIYVHNQSLTKKVGVLDMELIEKDKILQDEFSNNKILNLEKTIDDANILLSNHKYYTKVIEILQDDLIENIFLENFMIEKEKDRIILSFKGVAKTNFDVAKQINFLKKKDFVIDVFVDKISVDKNNFVTFDSIVYLKEDVVNY